MSVERNKATYRRWFEEVAGKGDLEVFDELIAPGYVVNVPDKPSRQIRAAEHKAMITAIHAAFSDWTETIDDILAEDDKVVVRLTIGGTHDGPFHNFPASGKHVESSFIGIARFEDGKIAEAWTQFDGLGFAQQIGLLPELELPQ